MSNDKPAFPNPHQRLIASGLGGTIKIDTPSEYGMTMRQYYAARAPKPSQDAMARLQYEGLSLYEAYAKLNFEYADAMLKEGENAPE